MARIGTIAAVLLVALAGSAAARHLEEPAVHAGEWAHNVVDVLKEWSNDRIQVEPSVFGEAVKHNDQEDRFYLLVKYIIRPSIAKEFSKAWLKVRHEATKEKGSIRFNLSKTLTDNLVFYSYEEWECKGSFIKYLKEEDTAAKKLASYIEEKDIPLVLTELKPAVPYEKHGDHHHGGRITKHAKASLGQPMNVVTDLLADAADNVQEWFAQEAAESSVRHSHSGGRSPHKAYLLIKYIVKPSEAEGFIKAVAKVTKAVSEEEEGSDVYGLSKTLTDDVLYYSYAVWDSKEAVEKHLKSTYAKELREYIIKNDIYAQVSPLIPIEGLED